MTVSPLRRGWVKFPNIFIDLYMPRITDTEWRVLCVVIRQTLGWNNDGPSSDWLSHSQLKRRTGRESAAISSAIAKLCDAGLLTVRDEDGRRLDEPHDRRRSRARLHYSIPYILIGKSRSSESENNNKYRNKRDYL